MSADQKEKTERLLLAIPCYNEAASIAGLLDEIQRQGLACDVLVIDDGSQDDTFALASARARCVRLPVNLGIGGAVQTGFRFAHQHDFDLCLQIDGDGQHPPEMVPALLAAYRRSPANIIIGSRFLEAGGFQSSWARRIGIAIVRGCLRLLFGSRVTDPTSGLRLLDRKAIELFAAEYPTDFPEPISIAVASCHGLSVREIPARMRPRATGRSSIRGLKAASYVLRVVGYLLLTRVARSL